ncbi:hypothetical protein Nhal_3991 (plasmid) [Nitrosococcus halophilus Nc 4]|uniref:DUF397 domain-containing protein n=1 Tax=Nitrosococcus halophilus (strain Nc4) TaxID=472759 RepID=D5C5E6_NITHN|nr:hypothetical protein [Nitrosococcus halophilus]ADE17000.1 hypothetical protein Nhal_3991 [Nitrosococcus halophilus Nc 4]
MRKIFQFDGLDGETLSVGECKQDDRIALCISNGERETHMLLSRDEWEELMDLRYKFTVPSNEAALTAVQ